MKKRQAVFLDRDGVINENRHDYVKSWDEFVFLPTAFEALRRLAKSPFVIIVVSNQSAIHRGLVSHQTVKEIHQRMVFEIQQHGGRIDAIFYCPHRPDEGCDCRKPRPGLLLKAARQFNLDLSRSFLIGDAVSDVEAALAAGCQPVFVLSGRGKEQLPLLKASGINKYHLAVDLLDAVDWILQRNSEGGEG